VLVLGVVVVVVLVVLLFSLVVVVSEVTVVDLEVGIGKTSEKCPIIAAT